MIGTTLGHYRILEALGAGGMGEVFVAHDTKLDRKVALKVLPASVAADPDRRERFAREARAVAALNHPNIVTVHSVEEAGDVYFLTMELVEGRTLADLIPAKGLPLDQLLKIAIPLTDAVSAAHAKGITHRDLKPANVMVTTDGRVKVLDFGLAKLTEDASSVGDSMTNLRAQPLTGEGRIVGTVTYMSPEQAEGKPVDHRSDIFSLGVILYEMATGERPFKGDSNVSTLSSILRDTPKSVTEINPALPRDLAKIIRRVLTKDPEDRYQSAKDLRNELKELKQELDSGELAVAAPAAVGRARSGLTWILIAAGAVVVVMVAVTAGLMMVWRQRNQSASAPLEVAFTQITSAAGIETSPSLSPDGKWIVYSAPGPGGDADIFLQSADKLSGQAPFNLTKDQPDQPAADSQPAFSPNGDSIAFRSDRGAGGIFLMDRMGGGVKRLTDRGYYPAWTPDGRSVLFSTAGTMDPDNRDAQSEGWRVDVETREKTRFTAGDFIQPAVSPHQERVAYFGSVGGIRDVWTMRLDGSQPTRVTDDAATDWSPVWSSDGRFLYFASDRGGSMNLWRVAIDEASGRVLGKPESITVSAPWIGLLAFSVDGRRLAYAAYDFTRNIARVPFDSVHEKVIGPPEGVTTGTLDSRQPNPSADGTSVVFTSYHRQEDLYVARLDATGAWKTTQLTNDSAKDRAPNWSPDGKQIAYYSNKGGAFTVWTINPDGAEARARVSMPDAIVYAVWAPDGSRVASTGCGGLRRVCIFALGDAVSSAPAEILPPFQDPNAILYPWSWSADGRRVAGNGPSMWMYSFDTKTYTQFATGAQPVWLADSRRLVCAQGGKLYLVDTATKQSHEILAPSPGETLNYPSLTRDNRYLYYTHATTGADIWVMTIK